jgi:serine/threonine-protein kinase
VPHSDLYALGVLLFEMLTGQLPFRSSDREQLLEMQRTSPAPRPRGIRPEAHPGAEAICLRLLEKDVRKRYQDAHHLQEELKALQRTLPTQSWDIETAAGAEPIAPPPPPPPQTAAVTEWANRAAILARMVSRAYPNGNAPPDVTTALGKAWDLAARANRLEGEVSSYTRRLDSLERRGRALRAEIGRKVEELAHEESRVLREASADSDDCDKVKGEIGLAERAAIAARQQADLALRTGAGDPVVFERAGAAAATLTAKKEQLGRYESKKSAREATARDLRKQIEDLRSQLARYAEALDEDLASWREKVGLRTREGLSFEKGFSEACNALLAHLRGKPECRDLMTQIMAQPPILAEPGAPPSSAAGAGTQSGTREVG